MADGGGSRRSSFGSVGSPGGTSTPLGPSPRSDRERNIQVAVRVRPLSEREQGEGHRVAWSWHGSSIVQEVFAAWDTRGALASPAGRREEDRPSFTFDHLFMPEATTAEIYGNVMQDIVDAAMDGYHASVFAYGQTSTGKTYTMQGTAAEPGVIPLAVHACFRHIEASAEKEFVLRVSYMEIYQEQMHDLLSPATTALRIMEDARRGAIVVRNLKEEVVINAEQVFALISAGEAHRHVGATDFNAYSSRSHTIFRLTIESRDKAPASGKRSRTLVSTLNLVDLAGSESAKATKGLANGASQARAAEGKFINKSLLTLSKIIQKLSSATGGKDAASLHLPFRESKLTRLLQPALRGNAQVAVVCTVTPSDRAVEESVNTLKFASRAKRIRQRAQRNEVVDNSSLLAQYKSEIEELRAELALAQQIARQASAAGIPQASGGLGYAMSEGAQSPFSSSSQGGADAMRGHTGSPLPRDSSPGMQLDALSALHDEDDPEYQDIADIQDTIVKLQRLILQGGHTYTPSPDAAALAERGRSGPGAGATPGAAATAAAANPSSFFVRGRLARMASQQPGTPTASAGAGPGDAQSEDPGAEEAGVATAQAGGGSSGSEAGEDEEPGSASHGVLLNGGGEADGAQAAGGAGTPSGIAALRGKLARGTSAGGGRSPEDVRQIVTELRSIQRALGGVLDRRRVVRNNFPTGPGTTPRLASLGSGEGGTDPFTYPTPNRVVGGPPPIETGASPVGGPNGAAGVLFPEDLGDLSEDEVLKLKSELAAKQAESTLTQADSRFLESQLAEKDRLLDELFGMVEEVQAARELLLQENQELKLQNGHLQEVLGARETELRALKGVTEEEETF